MFKRLGTDGHFPDQKHTAKGQRDNKKIQAKLDRHILNNVKEFAKSAISEAYFDEVAWYYECKKAREKDAKND